MQCDQWLSLGWTKSLESLWQDVSLAFPGDKGHENRRLPKPLESLYFSYDFCKTTLLTKRFVFGKRDCREMGIFSYHETSQVDKNPKKEEEMELLRKENVISGDYRKKEMDTQKF